MGRNEMGQDKFIELDVRKLKDIEAERKRLLETAMQESPDIHFMCCPRCSRSLDEKIISDIKIVLCEQCRGIWIDKKSLSKVLRLSGDITENFLDQL
jgi:hypothetical protein